MIRHHYKFVRLDSSKPVFQFASPMLDYFASGAQLNCAFDHITKQTGPILRHDCDEIRAGLCIIVFFQSGRPTTGLQSFLQHKLFRQDSPVHKNMLMFFADSTA